MFRPRISPSYADALPGEMGRRSGSCGESRATPDGLSLKATVKLRTVGDPSLHWSPRRRQEANHAQTSKGRWRLAAEVR